MRVDSLDHLVLTVKDIETTASFYANVLGMDIITFAGGRRALSFGTQKINLHPHGNEFEPKAAYPTPGSADLCLITPVPLHDVVEHLSTCGIVLIDGPVARTGATGPLLSVYFRDPDMNLIEVSNRVEPRDGRPDPSREQVECRLARISDFDAIQQMLELYQHDLSDFAPHDLDSSGRFGYDLTRHRVAERSFAYLLLVDGRHAGLALVAPACVSRMDGCWMEQFFVLRRYRNLGLGRRLAHFVFSHHSGPWEIGEVPGNVAARDFWRRVISGFTNSDFTEVEVKSGWWQGTVQQFVAPAAAT